MTFSKSLLISVLGAVPIVRSLLSVAIRADATFVAAMTRTSCSVKPRVVIFHISASRPCTCCRDDAAIVTRVLFFKQPHIGVNRRLLGGRMSPSSEARICDKWGGLARVRACFCGAELRCASTRTGEHQWTRNPVPTLRERQRQFLTAAIPICRRVR